MWLKSSQWAFELRFYILFPKVMSGQDVLPFLHKNDIFHKLSLHLYKYMYNCHRQSRRLNSNLLISAIKDMTSH